MYSLRNVLSLSAATCVVDVNMFSFRRTHSFLLIVKLSGLPETSQWVVLGVLQHVWGDGCSLRWLPEVVTKSHQTRITPALSLGKNNGKFSSFLQQNRAIAT